LQAGLAGIHNVANKLGGEGRRRKKLHNLRAKNIFQAEEYSGKNDAA